MPLDSKVPRQEVSIDSDDSATETSMGTSKASSTCSSTPCDDVGLDEDHSARLTVSTDSCPHDSKPQSSVGHNETAQTAAAHDDHQSTQRMLDLKVTYGSGRSHVDRSTDQAGGNVSELNVAAGGTRVDDDGDMVHVYPQYLLSGDGLKLLQLCMAMWSRDPGARPSCEAILEQLATI